MRAAPRRCPALPLVPRSGPGGPAISRWVAPKKIPGLGFRRPTLNDRHRSSLAADSRLNVASELARIGRRTSRPGRPGAGERLGPGQPVSASTNPYQRPEGTVPTLHWRNYLTSRSDE
jgi:hypothetical protein